MWSYLLRRLFESALILLGITFVTFVLLYLVPADPARQIAGRSATAETVQNIREQLGLNDPLVAQYWRYLTGLAQGGMGRSYLKRAEVSSLIASRLPASLLLMVSAIVTELVIGLAIGVVAALNRNRPADHSLMILSFVAISAPQFVIGILLIYVFAVQLGWFPIGGYGTFAHLVLPSVTLGLPGAGWYSRMMRASMIEVLTQDFVHTARAKGPSELRIVTRHVMPNAILPIIAMIGLAIGLFMSGIVVVESVFGWPGIGQLAWQAIQRVDIPVIMGVTMVSATAIVLGNLLADFVAPLIAPPHQDQMKFRTPARRTATRTILMSMALGLSLTATGALAQVDEDAPQGGEMTVTCQDDAATLDPAIGYDWQNWLMIKPLFDGLMGYEPGTTTLRNELAESHEVSEDGLTHTFVLRDGIMFHNRREITAQDVKYSLDRVTNPETRSPGAGFFGMIEGFDRWNAGEGEGLSGVRVIDDRTVEITLSRPDATFRHVMALNFASIVPREAVEEAGEDFGRRPVGSGAFRLAEWTPGQQLVLERFEDYHREGVPKLDRASFNIGLEPTVALLRIQNGDADVPGDGIPPAQFLQVTNDAAYEDQIVEGGQLQTGYITMNTQMAPFDDVDVRKAVNMAIDEDRIVQMINNRAVPANQPLPPSMPGYDEDYDGYAYDPEAARRMLTDAGFPDGFEAELFVMNVDPNPRIAQAIQQDLSEIGISAAIRSLAQANVIAAGGEADRAPMIWPGGMA